MKKKGRPISERNAEFYSAWENWIADTNKKQHWDMMFMRVYDACLQAVKACFKGRVSMEDDDLADKAIDASCRFMEKIRDGKITLDQVKNSSLAAFVHYPVLEAVYGPKVQKADAEICVEDTVMIDYQGSYVLDEDWLCQDIDEGNFDSDKTYLIIN